MPLIKQEVSATRAWGLWKIEEPEEQLRLAAPEIIPQEIKHPEKRLEYLAVRAVIKKLLNEWGMGFEGLTKNEHGKPFLKNSSLCFTQPFLPLRNSHCGQRKRGGH